MGVGKQPDKNASLINLMGEGRVWVVVEREGPGVMGCLTMKSNFHKVYLGLPNNITFHNSQCV